jgi:hypothetical protein
MSNEHEVNITVEAKREREAIFDADGALTREYLLSRGACCGYGCRNCPYSESTAATRAQEP